MTHKLSQPTHVTQGSTTHFFVQVMLGNVVVIDLGDIASAAAASVVVAKDSNG